MQHAQECSLSRGEEGFAQFGLVRLTQTEGGGGDGWGVWKVGVGGGGVWVSPVRNCVMSKWKHCDCACVRRGH